MTEIEKGVAVFLLFIIFVCIMILGFNSNNERFDKIEKELHELKIK